MKIISMIKIKITKLYQTLLTTTKQEWKEHANSFFQDRVLHLKKPLTEEDIKTEEKVAWEEILEALLEGVDEERIPIYKSILENQHRYLKEREESNQCQPSKLPIIPIVRRILSDMTIMDLVGVQPMDGPVALVYKLRIPNKEETEEGTNLSLEIVSQAIEAYSRKLTAAWTLEVEQDLNSCLGLNFEAELTAAIAHEVAYEHNTEWLHRLSDIANQSSYEIDDNAELIIAINKAANDIAANTRRGAGNWIVVSPTTLARIQEVAYRNMSPRDMFVAAEEPSAGTDLKFVGTLNKTMKVYVNMYATDDEILVGYKGVNGELDTGLIFSPYVMLMPSGVVIDPETFEPRITLMTRYGVAADDDSHNYYEKLKITYKDKK